MYFHRGIIVTNANALMGRSLEIAIKLRYLEVCWKAGIPTFISLDVQVKVSDNTYTSQEKSKNKHLSHILLNIVLNRKWSDKYIVAGPKYDGDLCDSSQNNCFEGLVCKDDGNQNGVGRCIPGKTH